MKILICGDSYMALDTGAKRKHMNVIHWSNHLGEDVHPVNKARPGSSNTMILMQLQKAISNEKFDGIVLGFTAPFRLEFNERTTSCHPWISQDQKLLDSLYRNNIHWEAELARNVSTIEYTILLARKNAPTVFTLNLFADFIGFQSINYLVDLKESLPLMLSGHKEFDDPTAEVFATFHLSDPKIHELFACQVRQYLAKI